MTTRKPPPRVRLYEPITGDRTAFWRSLHSTYGDVAPVEVEPGLNAWLLLSYKLNRYVLRQDPLFSRDPRQWRDMENGTINADSAGSAPPGKNAPPPCSATGTSTTGCPGRCFRPSPVCASTAPS